MSDETTYGSLGRLAPDWASGEGARNLTADDIYERFFDWAIDVKGIEPWPHQEEAIMDILAGDHVILNTPTGSGKSLVALGMHFAALCTGRRSYYTAPIKALVSEKFFDLIEVFGRENVGMITGDSHINADAPIICCTAEILANQALREGEHADVGLVAMDEFHYFGDPERGWAWQVPLLTLPQTQFLLMSATLGNVDAIANKLSELNDTPDVDVIANAPRPVPLNYEYTLDPLERTVELAYKDGSTPIYVVHFSQDAALETAQALASTGVSSKEQRNAIAEAIKGVKFTTAFGKILQRLLRTGIGVHHAGMLPRYRRLVEQLAQQGLLSVICGTDTLGVGINVPIHCVVLTALTKYDGNKMRKLKAREFHQIAGRAGRMGFDTEGLVIAEAPEFEIENQKAIAKAGGDPKKLKKIKRKKAPEGFVNWNQNTFDKLIDAEPETLVPHLKITHSMVLNEVEQGGDARERIDRLIDDSAQTPDQKERLHQRADEIFQTLFDTEVIETERRSDGSLDYLMTLDMPDDFALDQPLSPFLLAALELLDPESETYALDVISMVEATLEDPRQVLRAQERAAKDKAMADMKADGLDYDERMDRLAEITYPKPLEDLLDAAFTKYRHDVPWANDYWLSPKSVVRDMVETASDFTGYIARYNIARSEGTLLRYLSDAYRSLARTVPVEKRDERLKDIIAWLRVLVRSIDSSLVDEWENAGNTSDEASQAAASLAAPGSGNDVVEDRRGLTVLVRNAMFRRVQLMDLDRPEELGALDKDWGYGVHEWEDALDDYYDEHEYVNVDAEARSPKLFMLDDTHERDEHTWKVRQIIDDSDGDHDWAITGVVDLDATQNGGEVVFFDYSVGN
ncbi:DEAD/DEAH box helicase [Bifidobacterium angulatum]|uniref:DEAD/DEAH box helicase n=1 Tax=Bifidobacterium angulatum DSM 20098 = JCM 7096 TaxID=518635 RepID=C4FG13_9BIFI|nr:DEAD/DEAH box helicase [Bifidobacterium angulatum]EEP20709.1 DEAD/DEAH box helicase [Bifidobacterium angulatum DSM 20098 = JCM 7096]KFI41192.1 DEAD box family helicase [Bifidobacterium angulatum]BAQ96762.1 helicase [Bifidobacterium angulatum DSM 20098 = JCM 7096]